MMKWRFIITGRCNLHCYFCMKEYCPSAKSDTLLDKQDFKKLINIIETNDSATEITITGGEPLLCANFSELIKACDSDNTRVTLVTNGTLLLDNIHNLEPLSEIHVSVHSLDFHEWQKITAGNLEQFSMLLKGIRTVRERFCNIPIRLNIVGTKSNGDRESIEKYIDFAKANSLSICVFREGYLDWARKNNLSINETIQKHEVWDLSCISTALVKSTLNQKMYRYRDVEIILRETSTHIPMWDSIWVDPDGYAYVDVMLSGKRLQLAMNDNALLFQQINELVKYANKREGR